MSLKKLVLFSLAVFLTVYVGTYAFIDMYLINKMFIKGELDAFLNIQKVQTQYIEKWLNENLNSIIFLSQTKSAREFEAERFKQNVTGFASINKRFRYISFIDANGYGVFSSIDEDFDKSISVADREYFVQSVNGSPYISEFVKRKKDEKYIIVFSAPVYDMSNTIKGVLLGSVTIDEIIEALEWSDIRETGVSYIINDSGLMLQGDKLDESVDISYLKNKSFKAGVYYNYKNEKVIGAISKIEFLPGNYYIVTEVNYNEATLDIRQKAVVWFTVLSLIFALISKFIYGMFAKRYFIQLGDLVDATLKFSTQRKYNPIKIRYQNEISDLANVFNDMMKNIIDYQKELQDKIVELDNEKEELRESNIKLKLLSDKHEVAMEVLRKQYHQLDEASKAKSIFIANISHELRNPLNVSINYLEYVLEENDSLLDSEHKKNINVALNSAIRLQAMINELLDLSMLETGKIKNNYSMVDLNELLLDIIRDKNFEIKEKNLLVQLSIQPQLQYLYTDESRLRQILDNIISNAIKFADCGLIEISVKSDDKTTDIFVRDEGIGIHLDVLDKVFEPFFQVDSSFKKKYNGVGLGLSISQKLTKALGGDISVKNNADKGCTFRLTFPRNKNAKEE